MSIGGFAAHRAALDHAAGTLELSLSDAQAEQLLRYLALVAKWTQVYNLTAVRDPAEMLTHHLFDCLAAVPPLQRQAGNLPGLKLLDVGSGAGLPGVVFAVCFPDWQVHCIDTVAKKAAFVQQAAAELGLLNLQGVHGRVEKVMTPHDVVCARAFASLADFTAWTRSALASGGVWMALKGKHPEAELEALPPNIDVFHVEPLAVPQLNADRCIVWMRPVVHPVA